MTEPVFISVREIVDAARCIATDDGHRVRERITPSLREGRRIVLSFAGVEMVIAAFLSSAIGQLYGEFPEAQVDSLVVVQDLPEGIHPIIESSRCWAKAYYRDPVAYESAIQEALDE
jgi:hypothetical protein